MNTFKFAPVSDRIANLREKRDVFNNGALIKLNIERTKLYTEYYKAHPAEHALLKRSGAMLYWAQNREINVYDDDIYVGTTGPDERGLGLYVDTSPEWILGVIDVKTFKKAWQSGGPISMTDEERDILADAYEVWKDISLSKCYGGVLTDDIWDGFGIGSVMNGPGKFDPGFRGTSAANQGHYTANFNKAVNVGFGEVRRQCLQKIEEHKGKIFGDWAKKHVFYHAIVRVCDAAIIMSKRYAAACREKAEKTADPVRRAELLKMADSLEWIMENPARTYWEGLQVHIFYQIMLATDCQQHGQSMGRVDKHVNHLLERELASGDVTMEQAQELTDAFILKLCDIMIIPGMMLNNRRVIELNEQGMNAYMAIYSGFTATGGIVITIGGTSPNGEDESNTTTRLLLTTYGRMHLSDPTLALRVNSKTPDDIWRLAIESSKLCGGVPQIHNDEVIIPSLQMGPFTHDDAYDYSIIGCVEPGGNGNEWSASGNNGAECVWNMMEVIQLCINGGVNPRTGKTAIPCKKLYEYDSFEEFLEIFKMEMRHCLEWAVSYCSMYELAYSLNYPCVVASSMMEGCIESGLDVTEGGAKYNRTGMTACGTGNVGDSLMAIKKLCFDDKIVSLKEMYDALQANWEGYEDLRQTIINDVPHYGNDIEEVDELAAWGLRQFAEIMLTLEGPRGRYSGGTFTVTAHIGLGAMLGATPDGRKAGEPIADAISSRQGFDKKGPTAYLRSAAKLPHSILQNGDALNIRFSPSAVSGDEGAMKLRNLIKTYFKLGGQEVQFNVVGTDKLRAAQKNPLEYKDLIVRIAGFSTYFVTLHESIQNDFITRTEQSM